MDTIATGTGEYILVASSIRPIGREAVGYNETSLLQKAMALGGGI